MRWPAQARTFVASVVVAALIAGVVVTGVGLVLADDGQSIEFTGDVDITVVSESDEADGEISVSGSDMVESDPDPDPSPTPPPDPTPDPVGEPPDGVTVVASETVVTPQQPDEHPEVEATSVERIEFWTSNVAWDVTVRELDDAPKEAKPVPGEMVTVTQIAVPEDRQDQSAVIEMALDESDLGDIERSDLQAQRYADGEWHALDTELVDETDTGVVLEAETERFSLFAVSAVADPEAAIDIGTDPVTAGEDVELSAEASSDPYGEVVASEWELDGETYDGETVTTTVDDPGEYTVTLTITNEDGATDTETATLTVEAEDDPTDEPADDDPAADEPTDDDPADDDDDIPGFGVTVALVGLLVAALFVGSRRR